jgi:hypothetical protein
MSNFTTAGNLAVSQNVTIGGNCIISGNLIPTGNLNLSGNLNATNLNVNSTVKYNNSLSIEAGSGPLKLNANPIYGVNDGYNFISYSPLVGVQNGMQMAGYIGGQLGYTSQTGQYPSPITPVIYWNDSDRVGINTTSPNVTSGLHVNGDFRVNYESFLCVDGSVGNVYIGNSSAVEGGIVYINSDRPSTNTTSGSLVMTGGAGISGNVCIGEKIYCNRLVSNGLDDLKVYTGGTTNLLLNNDGDGSLIINETNFTGSTYFRNGDVYIGNTTSLSGNLIIQSNIAATGGGTGSLIVTGGTSISGNLIVSSAGVLKANSSVVSTTTTTGAITTKGGVGILGNINVGGNITTGAYLVGSRIVPNGSVDSSLRVFSPTSTLFLQNDSTGDINFMETNTTGTSRFRNGNVTIGNSTTTSGQLQILSGLASTTTGTGAVVVTGGVGISGDVNVGGTINGALSTTGNVTAKAHGFNYTAVPTLLNTQIGYKNFNIVNATSQVATTAIYDSISLPIGTYIFTIMARVINPVGGGTFRFGFLSGGSYDANYNITNTLVNAQSYGGSLTAYITLSTAGIQQYAFTNTMTITTLAFSLSIIRIA